MAGPVVPSVLQSLHQTAAFSTPLSWTHSLTSRSLPKPRQNKFTCVEQRSWAAYAAQAQQNKRSSHEKGRLLRPVEKTQGALRGEQHCNWSGRSRLAHEACSTRASKSGITSTYAEEHGVLTATKPAARLLEGKEECPPVTVWLISATLHWCLSKEKQILKLPGTTPVYQVNGNDIMQHIVCCIVSGYQHVASAWTIFSAVKSTAGLQGLCVKAKAISDHVPCDV
eukprot:60983-Prorocentrum_minimum.AAC.2